MRKCTVVTCRKYGMAYVPQKYIKRKHRWYIDCLYLCVEHLELLLGVVVKKKYGKTMCGKEVK